MNSVDLLGYTAGLFLVIALLPQVYKSWKTKSTKDISWWRYILYVIGLSLWVVYAFVIDNMPLRIMHGLEFLLALSVLFLKIRYDHQPVEKELVRTDESDRIASD